MPRLQWKLSAMKYFKKNRKNQTESFLRHPNTTLNIVRSRSIHYT